MPKDKDPVWCVVMFDLPVKTKAQCREATRFRNMLLDEGFVRAQFSVYVQYFPLATRVSTTAKIIKANLPAGGDIRILSVTDKQWSKVIRFSNRIEENEEEKPSQLMIF